MEVAVRSTRATVLPPPGGYGREGVKAVLPCSVHTQTPLPSFTTPLTPLIPPPQPRLPHAIRLLALFLVPLPCRAQALCATEKDALAAATAFEAGTRTTRQALGRRRVAFVQGSRRAWRGLRIVQLCLNYLERLLPAGLLSFDPRDFCLENLAFPVVARRWEGCDLCAL